MIKRTWRAARKSQNLRDHVHASRRVKGHIIFVEMYTTLRSKHIVSKIYAHTYFDNITTLSPNIHVRWLSLKLLYLANGRHDLDKSKTGVFGFPWLITRKIYDFISQRWPRNIKYLLYLIVLNILYWLTNISA